MEGVDYSFLQAIGWFECEVGNDLICFLLGL